MESNKGRDLCRKFELGLGALALFVLVVSSAGPTGAVSLSTTKPMKEFTVSLSGFVSESTAMGGEKTGVVSFEGATSADCGVSHSLRVSWKTSVLHYFDKSSAYPNTYEMICLTQFKSSAASQSNVAELTAKMKSSKAAHEKSYAEFIPGGATAQEGHTTFIWFARGQYSVFMTGGNRMTDNAAFYTGVIAIAQYGLLPKEVPDVNNLRLVAPVGIEPTTEGL
jgi:hypothetical protein